jgi:hypothetical protein
MNKLTCGALGVEPWVTARGIASSCSRLMTGRFLSHAQALGKHAGRYYRSSSVGFVVNERHLAPRGSASCTAIP